MELSYRYFGGQGNPPMVILHGLLGSSRNWVAVAKELVAEYEVFALDLRNHGKSPHADDMSYPVLANDVMEFVTQQHFSGINLLGHSLGGKVAMQFAVQFPSIVESLIVEDIVPKEYEPHHSREFEGMNALELASLESRKQADEFLSDYIVDWAQRQFILTNLVRDKDGAYQWAVNLKALTRHADAMRINSLRAGDRYAGPTLFVAGGKSDFVERADALLIQQYFPKNVLKVIEAAGHNVHVDCKAAFIEEILNFYKIEWGIGI